MRARSASARLVGFVRRKKIAFLIKSLRATGERDQAEIEAFEIDYWGLERKCIPDNKTNRECILVLRWFDAGAVVEMAGGVFANNANPLGRQRPPTQRRFSNNARH